MRERIQTLGEILVHIADQLPQMGLLYDAEPTIIGNRVLNVGARWPSSTQAWNAQEWGYAVRAGPNQRPPTCAAIAVSTSASTCRA